MPATAGYRADRAALFDYLLEKTMARESFSPVKNARLGLDVAKEMLRLREAVLDADTEAKLFYALTALSNARKDRHLEVGLVPGGLRPAGADEPELHAPVRFFTD